MPSANDLPGVHFLWVFALPTPLPSTPFFESTVFVVAPLVFGAPSVSMRCLLWRAAAKEMALSFARRSHHHRHFRCHRDLCGVRNEVFVRRGLLLLSSTPSIALAGALCPHGGFLYPFLTYFHFSFHFLRLSHTSGNPHRTPFSSSTSVFETRHLWPRRF